jgi:hypothetical protein
LIGLQEYLMNNDISYRKLSQMIGISSSAIGLWFKKKYVPENYHEFISTNFNIEKEYINKIINDIEKYDIRYKGFNEYKIVGDTTIIYLKRRNGLILECFIDTKNLQLFLDLGYSWHAVWREDVQNYYATCSIYKDGKVELPYMHDFIMKPSEGYVVDHIDQKKTLDNRENNLRIVERSNNSSNRSGANKNNQTGARNVHKCKTYDGGYVYKVQIMKKGISHCWIFPPDQFEEAKALAAQKREELFGKFKGKG